MHPDQNPPARIPHDPVDQPARPGGFYKILVLGHLDNRWSDWLGDMRVEALESGEMVLTGRLEDQAALMGVLDKLHRLNLLLLSINPISADDAASDRPARTEGNEEEKDR